MGAQRLRLNCNSTPADRAELWILDANGVECHRSKQSQRKQGRARPKRLWRPNYIYIVPARAARGFSLLDAWNREEDHAPASMHSPPSVRPRLSMRRALLFRLQHTVLP